VVGFGVVVRREVRRSRSSSWKVSTVKRSYPCLTTSSIEVFTFGVFLVWEDECDVMRYTVWIVGVRI